MCLVHVLPPSPAPRQVTLVHGTHSLPASFAEAVIAPTTPVHGLAPQHAGCLVAHVCTHTWPGWWRCARCGAPTVSRVPLSASHEGVLEVLELYPQRWFRPDAGGWGLLKRVSPVAFSLDHLAASCPRCRRSLHITVDGARSALPGQASPRRGQRSPIVSSAGSARRKPPILVLAGGVGGIRPGREGQRHTTRS